MSKLKKQLILSGVILAVFAVLLTVYFVLAPSDGDTVKETPEVRDEFGSLVKNGRPFIVDPIEVSDVKSIRIHNPDDDYTLLNHASGNWIFKGAENYTVDPEKLSVLRANTRYLLSVQRVENADLENLQNYGINLSDPAVWFEVEHKGGKYRVIVGDETPDSIGYYACLEGRDALYVLDTGIKESVLLKCSDYINPVISDPIETSDIMSLTRLSIFKGGDLFLIIDSVKDNLTHGNNSTHRLTYPVSGYATSLANFTSFLDAMADVVCEKTVLYGDLITPESLAELGFIAGTDDHICDYTLTAEYPKQKIALHFVEDGDNYLIYSESKNIVVSAPKTTFNYLEWELIAWLSSEIYLLDIFDVASVEFTSPTSSALFEVSGETDIRVTCGGKEVPATDFKSVYQSLMYVLITDWGEPPQDTSEIMRLVITLESGEVLDYVFNSVSAVNSFYTLNGEGQFYIEREKLLELRSHFESLVPAE